MANKKGKGAKADVPRKRTERRFEPRPICGPRIVFPTGAVGAFALGAGAWGQYGSALLDNGSDPSRFGPVLLVAGALISVIAVWLGSSGAPALRVGDAGIAVEKRGLRRMPWYAVERITWRQEAVQVVGKDDGSSALTIIARLSAQPQAAAWIAKEARSRIPSCVDIPLDATLPEPLAGAGTRIDLEPAQAVGKHCSSSGRVISFEPDARLCPRCERVYHKASVPETCACGAALAGIVESVT